MVWRRLLLGLATVGICGLATLAPTDTADASPGGECTQVSVVIGCPDSTTDIGAGIHGPEIVIDGAIRIDGTSRLDGPDEVGGSSETSPFPAKGMTVEECSTTRHPECVMTAPPTEPAAPACRR